MGVSKLRQLVHYSLYWFYWLKLLHVSGVDRLTTDGYVQYCVELLSQYSTKRCETYSVLTIMSL